MKEKHLLVEEYRFEVLHTTYFYMFQIKYHHYHTSLEDAVSQFTAVALGEKGSTLEVLDRQTGNIV